METVEHDLAWSQFIQVDMRIGTIISVEVFKEAKQPAYKLVVDFGDFGLRKSSAQITALYSPEELIGKQVVAVVNFPAKQIANFMSECLILGGLGDDRAVVLLQPERSIRNGSKVG